MARIFAPLTLALVLSLAGIGNAMPNYARSPGVSCFSCHSRISSGPASPVAQFASDEISGGSTLYVAPLTNGKLKAGLAIHKDKADQTWAGFASDNGFATSGVSGERGKSSSGGSMLSGLSGFISGEKFYAALGFIGRKTGFLDSETAADTGLWYRVGYAPQFGPVNLDMGLFGDAADMKNFSPSRISDIYNGLGNKNGVVGLDAGAQGSIGDDVSLSLKAVYLNSGDPLLKDRAYYTDGSNGFGAAARIGIGKSFGVSAAYHTYMGKTGESSYRQDAATIGADYNVSGKVTLKSQYTSYGLDKNALTGQDGGAFSILLISGF
ncbi:MAG: hypothetical protein HZB29_05220 [Nitrospinae bacterium]|nr:hypothetical protein [Nitrospinota bacterium]